MKESYKEEMSYKEEIDETKQEALEALRKAERFRLIVFKGDEEEGGRKMEAYMRASGRDVLLAIASDIREWHFFCREEDISAGTMMSALGAAIEAALGKKGTIPYQETKPIAEA